MFKNYIKVAIRNFFKNKTFSAINTFGLAIGFAAFLMALLWINNEFEYNQFHTNIDRLYRVLENQTYSGDEILTTAATPGPLSQAIQAEVPEVSMTTRTTWTMSKEITKGNTTAIERGRYVDANFLKMFSFPLKKGDIETALDAPQKVLISEKMADKYFGDNLAIGQMLTINGDQDFMVSGILEKIPKTSSLQFDFLLPFQAFESSNEWLQNWGNNGIFTWVLLKKQADLSAANEKIAGVLAKDNRQKNVELFMQSFADIYLYSDFKNGKYAGGGNIKNVRLFGLIGLMIMLIACINFMNLSTARSRTRSKEIGVRKVIGAQRTSLIYQFFTESFLTTLIAVLIGLFLVDMSLPYFNNLTGKLMVVPFTAPNTWLIILGLFVSIGFLAGAYPAIILSGFKPIEVLSQQFNKAMGNDLFRKTMVVGQFTIAVLLMIGTGVVFNQLRYMQHKDLGYNKEQLLYIPVKTETLANNYTALKTHLEQMPEVQSVSSGSHHLSLIGSSTGSISWDGKNPEENHVFVSFGTNYDILKTIDATVLAGRDFSVSFPTDSLNFIINESAAKIMGMDEPVGQNINWGDHTGQILAVVEDFHINSLKYAVDPAIMYIDPDRLNHVFVKLETTEMATTLAKLAAALEIYNPNQSFDYEFASEEYAQFYQSEKTIGELTGIFSLIGIFICCLGLFGLALFTIEQRTREIGIRKVLGATTTGIIAILSKDFLKLVMIALVVAFPLAWYFSDQWLQDFHYRIDTPWFLFLMVGVLALIIAFVTVSTQSVRAALANPIDSLRSE